MATMVGLPDSRVCFELPGDVAAAIEQLPTTAERLAALASFFQQHQDGSGRTGDALLTQAADLVDAVNTDRAPTPQAGVEFISNAETAATEDAVAPSGSVGGSAQAPPDAVRVPSATTDASPPEESVDSEVLESFRLRWVKAPEEATPGGPVHAAVLTAYRLVGRFQQVPLGGIAERLYEHAEDFRGLSSADRDTVLVAHRLLEQPFDDPQELERFAEFLAGGRPKPPLRTMPEGSARPQRLNALQKAYYHAVEPVLHELLAREPVTHVDSDDEHRQALLLPRNSDGTLSPAASARMMRVIADGLRSQLELFDADMGMTVDQAALAEWPAMVTPEVLAAFPEAESFLHQLTQSRRTTMATRALGRNTALVVDQNTPVRNMVVQSIQAGGTVITLHLDPTEPGQLRSRRVSQLTAAVDLVQRAGFEVPDFEVYLPKYTRALMARPGEGIVAHDTSWESEAQFYAPNRFVLSPELVGTAPRRQYSDGTFRSLAMQFDAQGVAKIIHELGYFLNFHHAPSRYLDAVHTKFREWTKEHVLALSRCASNTWEYAAEFLLGLVMGKSFTPDQYELYEALGGAVPTLDPSTLPTPDLHPNRLGELTDAVNHQLARRDELRRTATSDQVAGVYQRLPRDVKLGYAQLIASAVTDVLLTGQVGRILGGAPPSPTDAVPDTDLGSQNALAGPSGLARDKGKARDDGRNSMVQEEPLDDSGAPLPHALPGEPHDPASLTRTSPGPVPGSDVATDVTAGRGPTYPRVDDQVRTEWAGEFARAGEVLGELAEEEEELAELLGQAREIMAGRHQTHPPIAEGLVPGSAEAEYRALYHDMVRLIAASAHTDPRPGHPIEEWPAWALSERLRAEFGTRARTGLPAAGPRRKGPAASQGASVAGPSGGREKARNRPGAQVPAVEAPAVEAPAVESSYTASVADVVEAARVSLERSGITAPKKSSKDVVNAVDSLAKGVASPKLAEFFWILQKEGILGSRKHRETIESMLPFLREDSGFLEMAVSRPWLTGTLAKASTAAVREQVMKFLVASPNARDRLSGESEMQDLLDVWPKIGHLQPLERWTERSKTDAITLLSTPRIHELLPDREAVAHLTEDLRIALGWVPNFLSIVRQEGDGAAEFLRRMMPWSPFLSVLTAFPDAVPLPLLNRVLHDDALLDRLHEHGNLMHGLVQLPALLAAAADNPALLEAMQNDEAHPTRSDLLDVLTDVPSVARVLARHTDLLTEAFDNPDLARALSERPDRFAHLIAPLQPDLLREALRSARAETGRAVSPALLDELLRHADPRLRDYLTTLNDDPHKALWPHEIRRLLSNARLFPDLREQVISRGFPLRLLRPAVRQIPVRGHLVSKHYAWQLENLERMDRLAWEVNEKGEEVPTAWYRALMASHALFGMFDVPVTPFKLQETSPRAAEAFIRTIRTDHRLLVLVLAESDPLVGAVYTGQERGEKWRRALAADHAALAVFTVLNLESRSAVARWLTAGGGDDRYPALWRALQRFYPTVEEGHWRVLFEHPGAMKELNDSEILLQALARDEDLLRDFLSRPDLLRSTLMKRSKKDALERATAEGTLRTLVEQATRAVTATGVPYGRATAKRAQDTRKKWRAGQDAQLKELAGLVTNPLLVEILDGPDSGPWRDLLSARPDVTRVLGEDDQHFAVLVRPGSAALLQALREDGDLYTRFVTDPVLLELLWAHHAYAAALAANPALAGTLSYEVDVLTLDHPDFRKLLHGSPALARAMSDKAWIAKHLWETPTLRQAMTGFLGKVDPSRRDEVIRAVVSSPELLLAAQDTRVLTALDAHPLTAAQIARHPLGADYPRLLLEPAHGQSLHLLENNRQLRETAFAHPSLLRAAVQQPELLVDLAPHADLASQLAGRKDILDLLREHRDFLTPPGRLARALPVLQHSRALTAALHERPQWWQDLHADPTLLDALHGDRTLAPALADPDNPTWAALRRQDGLASVMADTPGLARALQQNAFTLAILLTEAPPLDHTTLRTLLTTPALRNALRNNPSHARLLLTQPSLLQDALTLPDLPVLLNTTDRTQQRGAAHTAESLLHALKTSAAARNTPGTDAPATTASLTTAPFTTAHVDTAAAGTAAPRVSKGKGKGKGKANPSDAGSTASTQAPSASGSAAQRDAVWKDLPLLNRLRQSAGGASLRRQLDDLAASRTPEDLRELLAPLEADSDALKALPDAPETLLLLQEHADWVDVLRDTGEDTDEGTVYLTYHRYLRLTPHLPATHNEALGAYLSAVGRQLPHHYGPVRHLTQPAYDVLAADRREEEAKRTRLEAALRPGDPATWHGSLFSGQYLALPGAAKHLDLEAAGAMERLAADQLRPREERYTFNQPLHIHLSKGSRGLTFYYTYLDHFTWEGVTYHGIVPVFVTTADARVGNKYRWNGYGNHAADGPSPILDKTFPPYTATATYLTHGNNSPATSGVEASAFAVTDSAVLDPVAGHGGGVAGMDAGGMGSAAAVEDTEEAERRRLIQKIEDDFGILLDSNAGVEAVRRNNPGAAETALKRILPLKWPLPVLVQLDAALENFAPIAGKKRADSSLRDEEQPITKVGSVNWALRQKKLFPEATGQYFKSDKLFNLYTPAHISADKKKINKVAVHEAAHGFFNYALPAFTKEFWEGAESPWSPLRVPPKTREEDFRNSIASYLQGSKNLHRDAPRHARAVADLRERRPDVVVKYDGESFLVAAERITQELSEEIPSFAREVGTWTEDGRPRKFFPKERPPTEYAETNSDEDQAESVMLFFTDYATLTEVAPLRAAFIGNLVKNWTPMPVSAGTASFLEADPGPDGAQQVLTEGTTRDVPAFAVTEGQDRTALEVDEDDFHMEVRPPSPEQDEDDFHMEVRPPSPVEGAPQSFFRGREEPDSSSVAVFGDEPGAYADADAETVEVGAPVPPPGADSAWMTDGPAGGVSPGLEQFDSFSVPSEDELLDRLRRDTVVEDVSGIEVPDVTGVDLFGRWVSKPRPEFLRHVEYGALRPEQVLYLFDRMNLLAATPRPEEMVPAAWRVERHAHKVVRPEPGRALAGWSADPAAPPLPDRVMLGIPKIWYSIWLGSVLRPAGRSARFWNTLAASALEHRDITFVHLTMITREQVHTALSQEAAPQDARGSAVWGMVRWAREHAIRLINIDELYHADHPMPGYQAFMSSLAMRNGEGAARASDSARGGVVDRFGGLYLDGNKTLLPGRDAFAEVVNSATMFAYTEGNNSGYLAPAAHPLMRAFQEEIKRRYSKDEVELYRTALSWQGIDGNQGVNLARRMPVVERTGPFMVTQVLIDAGWYIHPTTQHPHGRDTDPHLNNLPALQLLEGSWLYQAKPEVKEDVTTEEIHAIVADITDTLTAQLYNLRGHLDLTAIEEALDKLPDPEAALSAALTYLATREDLRTRVRGYFGHQQKGVKLEYKSARKLTPFTYLEVARRFLHDLPEHPSLIGDQNGWWLLHRQATRAVLLRPDQNRPSTTDLERADNATRPDEFGLHRLPTDPWPTRQLETALEHLQHDSSLTDTERKRARRVIEENVAAANRNKQRSHLWSPETREDARAETARILATDARLALPADYTTDQPLPLPDGLEARLLPLHHGRQIPEQVLHAVVHAVARSYGVGTPRHDAENAPAASRQEAPGGRARGRVGPRVPRVLDRPDFEAAVRAAVAAHREQGAYGAGVSGDREASGPVSLSSHELSAQECLLLLGALRDELFPQGVAPAHTVDDSVLGVRPQESRLALGEGWKPVGSWEGIEAALAEGSVALVLARRPSGMGHAVAAYRLPADRAGRRGKVVWVDLAAGGKPKISTSLPSGIVMVDTKAVVVDHASRVIPDALPDFRPSASTAHALVDASADHQYGAIGMELEWERWGVLMPEGVQPDVSYSIMMAQGTALKIVMEDWEKSTPFIETVGRPLRVLLGDKGRHSKEVFFREAMELQMRLARTSGAVPFLGIFSRSLGFIPRPDIEKVLQKTRLYPIPGRVERITPQFTVGTALSCLYDMRIHIRDETPQDSPYLRQHIDNALRFGSEIAMAFASTAIPGLKGLRLPPQAADLLDRVEDVRSVRGTMALVYTQVAAEAYWTALRQISVDPPLAKNLTATVSKTWLSGLLAGLSPDVQKYLADNVPYVRSLFSDYFNLGLVNDGLYADEFRRVPGIDFLQIPIEVQGQTLGDYLESGLRKSARPLDQTEVLGLHVSFPHLDTNDGNLDIPLAVEELRFYGDDAQGFEEMSRRFDTLAQLSRQLYEDAQSLRDSNQSQRSSRQVQILAELARSDDASASALMSFLHGAASLDAALPHAMSDGLLLPTATVQTLARGVIDAMRVTAFNMPHPQARPAIEATVHHINGLISYLDSLPTPLLRGEQRRLLTDVKQTATVLRRTLDHVLQSPPPKLSDLRNDVNLHLRKLGDQRVASEQVVANVYQRVPADRRSNPRETAEAIADILRNGAVTRVRGGAPEALTEPAANADADADADAQHEAGPSTSARNKGKGRAAGAEPQEESAGRDLDAPLPGYTDADMTDPTARSGGPAPTEAVSEGAGARGPMAFLDAPRTAPGRITDHANRDVPVDRTVTDRSPHADGPWSAGDLPEEWDEHGVRDGVFSGPVAEALRVWSGSFEEEIAGLVSRLEDAKAGARALVLLDRPSDPLRAWWALNHAGTIRWMTNEAVLVAPPRKEAGQFAALELDDHSNVIGPRAHDLALAGLESRFCGVQMGADLSAILRGDVPAGGGSGSASGGIRNG
ncbi:hypothetical protein ACWD7F_15930 [Streptomyces sp. NPDC005122]